MSPAVVVRDVSSFNLDRVIAFLESHLETSMFLLSNLAAHGPRLTSSLNSGNYRSLSEGDQIRAVWCLTRQGSLLAQAAGRTDCVARIIAACEVEPLDVTAVLAEWSVAQAIEAKLVTLGQFRTTAGSAEVLYQRELSGHVPVRSPDVRRLDPHDFGAWSPLHVAYLDEIHANPAMTLDDRRREFAAKARAGHWWGLFAHQKLISIASLNAVYQTTGQVGGVYTPPSYRRHGHAKAVIGTLMRDARDGHGLGRLILFTDEHNPASRRVYKSHHFEAIGRYGLILGGAVHQHGDQSDLAKAREKLSDIVVRPAEGSDIAWLSEVFLHAMRASIAATRGEWDEPRERQQFLSQLVVANTSVVTWHGVDVGFLSVGELDGDLLVHTLVVAQDYQGLGIGTSVMRKTIDAAIANRHGLTLWVLRANTRARHFYERLEFAVLSENATHLRLRRP